MQYMASNSMLVTASSGTSIAVRATAAAGMPEAYGTAAGLSSADAPGRLTVTVKRMDQLWQTAANSYMYCVHARVEQRLATSGRSSAPAAMLL